MISPAGLQKLILAGALLALGLSSCSKKEPEKLAVASASAAVAVVSAPATPSPAACLACEQKGVCAELSDGCSKFEGDARAQCEAVQQCINTSNCADGAKTLTSCYCGELGTSACIEAPLTGAGAPAGPCAEVIRKAMGGADLKHSQVLTRYLKPEHPGGAAIARLNCDKVDPACTAVCGF